MNNSRRCCEENLLKAYIVLYIYIEYKGLFFNNQDCNGVL